MKLVYGNNLYLPQDYKSCGAGFDAVNMVNKANSATRYVHPTTGQSVVIDNVTKELLHVGGPGFKY